MRRVRIKVTEVEVDLEDSQVAEVLDRALGSEGGPLAAQDGALAALPRGHSAVGVALKTAARPVAVAPDGRGQARARAKKKRGSGGRRARALGEEGEQRRDTIEQVCSTKLPQDERYNAAIRRTVKAGDRAMLVLRLAKEHFKLDGLVPPEIVRILERKFATPLKTSQVTMALVRAADAKGSPLVAGRRASWTHKGTEYWLTQDGMSHLETLLGAAS